MQNKTERNSAVELLRIFSMFLIVTYHALPQIAARMPEGSITGYTEITDLVLGSWGILGVDIFLIISAWYLSASEFKARRLLNIGVTVFCWYFIYTLIQFAVYYNEGNGFFVAGKNLFRCLLDDFFSPLWSECYWFVTSYFFMVLLSPCLNKILALDRSKVKTLLIVTAFIPVYSQYNSNAVVDEIYFMYIYVLTGYIRLYCGDMLKKISKPVLAVLTGGVFIASKYALPYLNGSYIKRFTETVLNNTFANAGRHSVVLLIDAFIIFGIAFYAKPFYNKFINKLSSRMFGVYLFHGNKNCLHLTGNIVIACDIAVNKGFIVYDTLYPLRVIVLILAVMLLGCIADYLLEKLAINPIMKLNIRLFGNTLAALEEKLTS